MEMQNVLASFQRLCDMPVAWGILAGMILHLGWSLVWYFTCPVVQRTARMNPERDRATLQSPFINSPRFLATMLVGLTLAVGGLYSLQSPSLGPLAIAAIMIGAFMLIVEPARLSVEENTRRVSAARLDGEDAYAFAHGRLRAAHLERIFTEAGIVGLLALLIVLT